jgi:translation initiation factor 2 beta subunit (eIF-2beta)/eIF-5
MQTQALNRYNHDRPAQLIKRLRNAFKTAGTHQRKASLIRRFAVAEKQALKVLRLFSTPPVSTLIH